MLLGMSFEKEKGGANPTLTLSSVSLEVSKFQSTHSRESMITFVKRKK